MSEKKYLTLLIGAFAIYFLLSYLNIPIMKVLFNLLFGCFALYYSFKGNEIKKWERLTLRIVQVLFLLVALAAIF